MTTTQDTLPGLATIPGDDWQVGRLLDWAIKTGASVHVVGAHGIGKTSHVKALVCSRGLRVVEKSLAVASPQDFAVPVPVVNAAGERELEVLVLDELLQHDPDDRYVLVLDEFSRATAGTRTTAMELLQEHTIAGTPLPGLAAVVAIDNPADGTYQGVGSLDLAQADRVATIHVTPDHLPWESAIGATYGIETWDLRDTWPTWPSAVRDVLCPRVVDHAITLAFDALPAEWALPVLANGRQRIVRGEGDEAVDVTSEYLDELIQCFGLPDARGGEDIEPARAIDLAIRWGWKLRLVGQQGIGKTSWVRAAIEAAGYEVEYLSLGQTSISDLVVPVPVDGALAFLPAARLVRPGRKYVLVLDEFSRARPEVASAAMELVQERSIAGRPLEGCVAVIALDNPREIDGIRFDAGRLDRAQASRFTATIELTEDCLPWQDHLTAKLGEAVAPFLAWRAEDLDDAGRVLVSPRCLERMCTLYEAGIDPALGLPCPGGERVPVPVSLLMRRLKSEAGLPSLSSLLDNAPSVLAMLREGDLETESQVTVVLQRTAVRALEQNADRLVPLLGALGPSHRLSLVRCQGRRGKLFMELMARIGGLA